MFGYFNKFVTKKGMNVFLNFAYFLEFNRKQMNLLRDFSLFSRSWEQKGMNLLLDF